MEFILRIYNLFNEPKPTTTLHPVPWLSRHVIYLGIAIDQPYVSSYNTRIVGYTGLHKSWRANANYFKSGYIIQYAATKPLSRNGSGFFRVMHSLGPIVLKGFCRIGHGRRIFCSMAV